MNHRSNRCSTAVRWPPVANWPIDRYALNHNIFWHSAKINVSIQSYQEQHSANINDHENVQKRHKSHKRKSHKHKSHKHRSSHKSQAESSATINGNTGRQCHECKLYGATFMCSNCQNQWYCSRECQVSIVGFIMYFIQWRIEGKVLMFTYLL